MSKSDYLDLKKTAITTTGLIFSPLIVYAIAFKEQLLAQYLIATIIVILLSIFIAFTIEMHNIKKRD
jgi:uncharacterized protein YacL